MKFTGHCDLALTGGTIFTDPSAEPILDGVVMIAGRTIVACGDRKSIKVPGEAEAIDCSGLTITAGFWNCHVHFFERKWANAAAIPAVELGRQLEEMSSQYGFTSVFDLSSPWENTRAIRDRIESGEVAGPRIRSTGLGLLPPDPGLPPDPVLNFMGLMKLNSPEVGDAQAAARASRELLETGVDAIKLFVSAPSKAAMSEETIRGAVEQAREFSKPVFIHPNSDADIRAAIAGGVDVIGHTTPRSGNWTAELIGHMRERGVALTPTLTLWEYFLRHDRVSVQNQVVNIALGQLRDWVDVGGAVLFGTDLGAVDYDPRDEYRLMTRAGMNFKRILASLTTAPAERFAGAQTGRVAAGLEADLVAFRGDPRRDIGALADVQYTVRGGRIVYHSAQ